MAASQKITRRKVPAVISASRLTDIPRWYAEWFVNRRRAGYAESGNSFGSRYWISLRPDDVLGYLFWTRDARPLLGELTRLRAECVPCAFQFTVTGYGPDLEANRVPLAEQIESFLAVSQLLPDAGAIQWRYDPILITDQYTAAWHLETFASIAADLAGSTTVVNTSLAEPYLKTVRRVGASAKYRQPNPQRHSSMLKQYPNVATISDPRGLLQQLSSVSASHGLELRVCANPELTAAPGDPPPARCCGAELFSAYGSAVASRISALGAGPTREGCRCLRTADIGMTDTCPGGCKYCYVVGAAVRAENYYQRHDPTAPSIR